METYLWHKDPSYKNLYETEIDILRRGLNGDLKLYKDPFIENYRVVAIGELIFEKDKKQTIAIIFPTKYPYAPPRIKAVNINIDSNGNLTQLITSVLFGKGNQYIDGSLCLLTKSFWNPNVHNIGWLLRRAQNWLISAHSKEGFKKVDIVEELPAFAVHTGQVLIPKNIQLPDHAITGNLFLTQFKPSHYLLEENIVNESPFILSIGREVFKWYAFNEDVTIKMIFPIFNGPIFIDILNKYFGENLLENLQSRNIAFYLPGEEQKWHFFKLIIQVAGETVNIIPQYYIARIVDNELYLRTKDVFDDKILLNKRATIIGLGALGSEVAKSLAKNGVGHFNLFDLDTFEIGNSIRHAADLFYIGESKVNVVKQLILRSNPNITVNAFKTDVLNDTGLLERSLIESDICICLTAEESVDYLMNDHYVKKYKIPFVFARASAGAFSGAIQIVNSESACLRCLSLYGLDTLPEPRTKIKFVELKTEYGSCSEPPLPGSEIDSKEIALMVARISMQALLQNESSIYPKLTHNQFYWHGPFGSDENEPFTWERKVINKHPDCKLCQ